MERKTTALDRAFELARSGKCLSVFEIQKRLKSEHLDASHLEGPRVEKTADQTYRGSESPIDIHAT